MATKSASDEQRSIIFDFDGTIADSFDAFVASLQEAMRIKQPLSPDEASRLRGLGTREVIKELGIKPWQLPVIMWRGKRAVRRRMPSVLLFAGMPQVITSLAQNHQLYIVSTNEKAAIEQLLKANGIANCFQDIYTGGGLFGKKRRLRALSRHYGIALPRAVYIGDETRDMSAAHDLGMPCIAVTWGYSTAEALAAMQPTRLARTNQELCEAIETLQ